MTKNFGFGIPSAGLTLSSFVHVLDDVPTGENCAERDSYSCSHGSVQRQTCRGRHWRDIDRAYQCVQHPPSFFRPCDSLSYLLPSVTPFDVVKTRLPTQPPPQSASFSRVPLNGCCQPNNPLGCVRNMSSYARPLSQEVVCIWDHGIMRTERVNGFWDAVRHVVRAEGLKGLWKGAGTTL